MTAFESPPRRRALASFRLATTLVLGALAIGSASAQTPGSAATPACDRACLTAIVDAYYAALVANDARKLP